MAKVLIQFLSNLRGQIVRLYVGVCKCKTTGFSSLLVGAIVELLC